MYGLVQGLAAVAYMIFFTWYGKKFNISRIKSFLLGAAGMVIYLILVKFLAWAETGFKEFGAENGIRVYVLLPIFMYALAKFAKVKPTKLFDMEAAACVLMYGLSHLACIFQGCCQGFQYYEGTPMYNLAMKLTGTNMLPVQLGESISALLVFALVYAVGHIKKYDTHGYLLCIWYIVFGTERFFWEFLRDNLKVFKIAPLTQTDGYIGISNLAIWSALMVLAGVILLFVFRHLEKKEKLHKAQQAATV